MKKIISVLFALLALPFMLLSASDAKIEQFSYFSIGPEIGYAGALESGYGGLGASFGTLHGSDTAAMDGTGFRVGVGFGLKDGERLPLAINGIGGLSMSFDLAKSLELRLLLGAAMTWESKISSKDDDKLLVLGIGGGIDATLCMYLTPRKNFAFIVDAYGSYCYILSDAVRASKTTFIAGASVGLSFNYGKRVSLDEAVDAVLDIIL